MNKTLHLLVFFISFCPCTWAIIEITGTNSFKYTDSAGNTKTREIHGYTKPENVSSYLQLAISDSKTILKTDIELNERGISKVYLAQFSADPSGFINQADNIGFIVILNDGTTLLSFDFLGSETSIASTYDEAASNAKLMSHLFNHGRYVGEVSKEGSMASLGLWSTDSAVNKDLKKFGFRASRKKPDRYQATFLTRYHLIAGQGTLEIRNLGKFEYTILESS